MTCQVCGERTNMGAVYCHYCGYRINISNNPLLVPLVTEQYRRCSDDIRHFDRLAWEIPFATTTAVATILAVTYGDKALLGALPGVVKVPLLSFLLVLVFSMALLLRKIRLFQDGRSEFASRIETIVTRANCIPADTKSCQDFFIEKNRRKRFVGYRAIHFQYVLYGLMFISLSYLIALENMGPEILLIVGGILLFCLGISQRPQCPSRH